MQYAFDIQRYDEFIDYFIASDTFYTLRWIELFLISFGYRNMRIRSSSSINKIASSAFSWLLRGRQDGQGRILDFQEVCLMDGVPFAS